MSATASTIVPNKSVSTSASVKAQALLATAVALVGAVVTLYFGMRAIDAPPAAASTAVAPPTPVAPPLPYNGPRTQDQAMDLLAGLPEIKAWNDYLTKSSGGASHGSLVRYSPTPKELGGKRYWQFSYIENTPEAAKRWENFLVGENTPDILVDDIDNARQIPLEQWRSSMRPTEPMVVPPTPTVPPPAAPAP